jgi:hydroxyacylglutathione hydrolase
MPTMNLGQERLYNPFLRLKSQGLIAQLEASGDTTSSSRAVFKALRLRRDRW